MNLEPIENPSLWNHSICLDGNDSTLPISSAAVAMALGLTGLSAGAATVGCCANMIGFAVASYRENKMGGLLAQGIGTSMLQVPNIYKNQLFGCLQSSLVQSSSLSTIVFK